MAEGDVRSVGRRIATTLMAPIAVMIGSAVDCPGIDPAMLESYDAFTSGPSAGLGSVFSLGLAPYLGAVILVEIVAWLAGAAARHTSEGRQKLHRYSLALTVILAGSQAYMLVSVLDQSMPVDFGAAVPTLVAGTVLLAALADLITRRGLFNGVFAVVFSFLFLRLLSDTGRLWSDIPYEVERAQLGLGLGIALVAVTMVALWPEADAPRRRGETADGSVYRTSEKPPPAATTLPRPASGLIGVNLSSSVVGLLAGLTAMEVIDPFTVGVGAQLALGGVFAVLLTYAFHPIATVSDAWGSPGAAAIPGRLARMVPSQATRSK